jgi:hypothetical protein
MILSEPVNLFSFLEKKKMNPKHRNRMTFLSILAAIIIFACQASGAAPTATPLPPTLVPTNTPEPPTAIPEPTATTAPTEAPAEVATETTVSGDPIIQIGQVHGFFDIYDTLNVVGLVTNNTDRVVDNVEIEIEVFDANDVSLYVETVYMDLFALAPGETSPFSLYVFDDLPEADNFVATVVGNSVTDLERATLEVANSLMTLDDDGNIHLTGELLNNTDQPVNINALAGAVFNANGDLMVSESYNVTIRYLDPGQSGPFRITMTGPDSGTADITNFQVYIDAEVTEAIDPINVTISDAVNYLDGFDDLHLVGQLTNDSDKVLSVYLVAGLYDAEGNVVDASSLTLPINALKPGEFSPYDFDFWGPSNSTGGLLDSADSYSVQVDAYWTWETTTELFDLTTANDTNEFDEFGGTFTGQVVNNSGGPVDSVTVVVYLVDKESGEIVVTDYTYLFEEIADGGTLDYTVYLDPEDGFDINTAEYFILVKGERP